MPVTDFPTEGDDKKVSLQNSQYPQFDRAFAEMVREDHPDVWRAGGNIRGNDAFTLWGRARDDEDTEGVLSWIREREAWAARHFQDGAHLTDDDPVLSNIGGVVAQMKWGVIGTLGEGGMKDAIRTVIEKQERMDENMTTTDGEAVYYTQEEAQAESQRNGSEGFIEYRFEDGANLFTAVQPEPEPAPVETRKAAPDIQRRTAELRATAPMVLEGYAALFDDTTDLGPFKERINRGAFDGVMDADVRLLLNHEGAPYARTKSGTMAISQDDRGLKYRAELGNTQAARDLYEMVKRGDMNQMSFGFTIAEQDWNEEANLRTINKIGDLYELSVVPFPAYANTVVEARNKKKEGTNLPHKQSFNMNFRTSTDAQRYISQLENKLQNVQELATSEERALTAEELEETNDIHAKLAKAEEMRDSLAKNESRIKQMAQTGAGSTSEASEMKNIRASYSFAKALREGGNPTGVEREMHQEARNEAGAMGLPLRGDFSIPAKLLETRNVYGVDSSQSGVNDAVTTVATEVDALVGALRSSSLLEATGATRLSGFVGDIKLPSLPTDAAETPVEGASVTGNTGAMGAVTLSPNRLAQQMIVTKEAINQTAGNMAQVIAADFGRSIAIAQDAIALKAIHGVGGAPALPNGPGTVVLGTQTGTNDLAATVAEDIRNLWSTITANGAENNTAFLMHPTAMARLMGLANVSSVSPLVENGSIFGYNALTSGSVPSIDAGAVYASQLIDGGADVALGAATGWDALRFVYYGDWTDLHYANWGGLDVTVDIYSGSSAGTVKIVVDTFFDAAVRRAESIGALPFTDATILGADT